MYLYLIYIYMGLWSDDFLPVGAMAHHKNIQHTPFSGEALLEANRKISDRKNDRETFSSFEVWLSSLTDSDRSNSNMIFLFGFFFCQDKIRLRFSGVPIFHHDSFCVFFLVKVSTWIYWDVGVSRIDMLEKVTPNENLRSLLSWESKGTPPMSPPPGDKALLRDY